MAKQPSFSTIASAQQLSTMSSGSSAQHPEKLMSKYAYFLSGKDAARSAYEGHVGAFSDGDILISQLHTLFDWMAEEQNATRMSSRKFKMRLPEIHRKFPQLTMSFTRMDANGDCWLEWSEFVEFCLKDKRLHETIRRAICITVYGVDKTGQRTFKEVLDPAHMCETGISPPMLPWEDAHIVEWRIEGLKLSHRGSPTTYGGMEVKPGCFIASPPFRAGGVCGFLRFWPTGYYPPSRRRKKASLPVGYETIMSDGSHPMPDWQSWCCIGAFVPQGTHLIYKFFVGDTHSDEQEFYWSECTHARQLWSPPDKVPPASLTQDGGVLVVGIEILRNVHHAGKHDGKEHLKDNSDWGARCSVRPALRSKAKIVSQHPSLKRSQSMPSLRMARHANCIFLGTDT